MRVTCTEVIAAPRAGVFEVFSDIPHAQERLTGVRTVEVLSSVRAGESLRWRETRVVFGKEATEDMEITAFDEPRGYVVEAESHGTHYVSRLRFDELAPDRTWVTWDFESRPLSLPARLLAPLGHLFQDVTKKMIMQDVQDLKRFIESSRTSAGS